MCLHVLSEIVSIKLARDRTSKSNSYFFSWALSVISGAALKPCPYLHQGLLVLWTRPGAFPNLSDHRLPNIL